MNYIRALIKEFGNLEKALEDGEISKYRESCIYSDVGSLLLAKEVNLNGLTSTLAKVQNEPKEKELVLTEIRKQRQEQLELETLINEFAKCTENFK